MATEQQDFWQGNFGTQYIERNTSSNLLAANINLFSQVFSRISQKPSKILELGANVGMNIKALKLMFPECFFSGVEINNDACSELSKIADESVHSAIEDYVVKSQFDFVFTKGVLIHIAPENLDAVYAKMYEASKRYILVSEYYNPSPVSIDYRGHANKLFKRDFAGELLEKYQSLELLDYGFSYSKSIFPQDDLTWFLLEKKYA